MKIILSIALVVLMIVAGLLFYFNTANITPSKRGPDAQLSENTAFVFLNKFDGIPVTARTNLQRVTFSPLGFEIAGYQTIPIKEGGFGRTSLLEYGFSLNEETMRDGTLNSSAVYERGDLVCLVESSAEMLDETTLSEFQTTLTCGKR